MKSYNEIINLNLLNLQKFLENVIGNKKKLLRNIMILGKLWSFIIKIMKNYLKMNYLPDLIMFTYKTIKKNNSVDMKEMENFLIKTIEQG